MMMPHLKERRERERESEWKVIRVENGVETRSAGPCVSPRQREREREREGEERGEKGHKSNEDLVL